jgi:two-component system response regulator AtoC
MEKILIIDDDRIVRKVFAHVLKGAGYDVVEADDGLKGFEVMRTQAPDLVLTDYQMPGITGLDLLEKIREQGMTIPVIMLTGYGDVMLTIKSVQGGVYDYIEKPADPELLKGVVRKALDSYKQSRVLPSHVAGEKEREEYLKNNMLVGKSVAMKSLFKQLGVISLDRMNVLVRGESGTGKEHIANLIHIAGVTKDKPFVRLVCSSLSDLSYEELRSQFELAEGGTLFLKDVQVLSESTQNRLLAVMQDYEGDKARVLSSGSLELDTLVEQGKFSEDLYYRLRVLLLDVPPLRERKEDIPELVVHFLYKLGKKYNKNVSKVADGVMERLQAYNWPGNVRELESVVIQGIMSAGSDVLDIKSIVVRKTSVNVPGEGGELTSLEEVEREYILKVLEKVGWNKVTASGILGITRPTLNAKIEKYRLKKK